MLTLDPDYFAAIEQSHQVRYRASAFYGAEMTIADVPLTTDGSLTYTADAAIQTTGSVFLANSGASYAPKGKGDFLAPYGQELTIDRVVTLGQKSWAIPMGRFRISRVPSASEYFRRSTGDMRIGAGWTARLDLQDRFDIIEKDDFMATTAPKALNTTWAEIKRISPLPIVYNLTDQPLPAGLVYETKAKAIATLMANLGGVPHINRWGALTARPANTWLTATKTVFSIKGTIDLDEGMSNDLYNSVVVTSNKNESILEVAEIRDDSNPLSVTRPIGRRTYRYQDPLATTAQQAQRTAQIMLGRLSTQQSRVAVVQCLPRPEIELGDYGEVVDPTSGKTIRGEVAGMTFSLNPGESMTLNLIVAETR